MITFELKIEPPNRESWIARIHKPEELLPIFSESISTYSEAFADFWRNSVPSRTGGYRASIVAVHDSGILGNNPWARSEVKADITKFPAGRYYPIVLEGAGFRPRIGSEAIGNLLIWKSIVDAARAELRNIFRIRQVWHARGFVRTGYRYFGKALEIFKAAPWGKLIEEFKRLYLRALAPP